MIRAPAGTFARLLVLTALCVVALQLYFAVRIAAMVVVDPVSTSFQRSEAWRLATQSRVWSWHQQWRPSARISQQLKRAVIASEDAGFTEHRGVEWDALQRAWDRNRRSEARADAANPGPARHGAVPAVSPARTGPPPKIVGGSTISQQLAKNLFLDGERNLLRKAQEFAITVMLETFMSKARILEIYLNSVEWGEGVFGAEAAAHRYFGVDAAALNAGQAAQLAVMLPAPKRFEKRPSSPYVLGRAATVSSRMGAVDVP